MWVLKGLGKNGKRLAAIGVPAEQLRLIASGHHVMALESLFYEGSSLLRADGIALCQADTEQELRDMFTALGCKVISIQSAGGGCEPDCECGKRAAAASN